jgi:DNA-binding transcriptional MerR regulator
MTPKKTAGASVKPRKGGSELLKIGQLADQAGVQKATVAYYVREGLLPPPVKKPHRNMAYYSSDVVERIKLIKELQTRRFLPLSIIKQLLADKAGVAEIRAYLNNQPLAPPLAEPKDYSTEALLTEAGLDRDDLHTLAEIGLIAQPKKGVYDAADAAIIRAVGLMTRAGLDAGFEPRDLRIYREAMENLIRKEITLFTQRVVGKRKPKDVVDQARAGLEGTNALLVALRRKIFLELLQEHTS